MKMLATLFLLLALAIPGAAQSNRETIHASMHSVFIAAGEEPVLCTAYAVGPNTIAIAEHCLGDTPEVKETILFIIDYKDGTGLYATNADTVLDGNDHALVVLKGWGLDLHDRFEGFTTWIHDAYPAYTPAQGERVIMWGAPMTIQCRDCYREGYFSGWARVQNHELMWFALSGTNGDSGALIFTESGRLVGEVSVAPPGFIGCAGFTFTAEDIKHIK